MSFPAAPLNVSADPDYKWECREVAVRRSPYKAAGHRQQQHIAFPGQTSAIGFYWMPQMLRLVCSLLLLGTTRAQIPLPCISDDVMRTGECCPNYWADSSPCGSASGRGVCQDIMDETQWQREERMRDQENTEDFRRWWPSYFFHQMCVCNENFWGADCGECKYGWKGPQCQESHVVVRRDFTNMTKDEQDIFIDRLRQSKYTLSKRYAIYASSTGEPNSPKTFREASVYNVAVWVHYICAKPLISETLPSFAHRATAFLVWHRLHLMYLEREIRNITQDENFFFPVWTWAGKSNCDVCTDDLFGSNNDEGNLSPSSMFSTWQEFERRTFSSGEGKVGREGEAVELNELVQ
ncbi:tyrosinase-like [Heterodontus francisci]|uniref:tyrosinase-like n=1 Tax=Heterodontus francisci TaxID=7792 RepID=UPI00355B5BE0